MSGYSRRVVPCMILEFKNDIIWSSEMGPGILTKGSVVDPMFDRTAEASWGSLFMGQANNI